jgi:hypothetical protein
MKSSSLRERNLLLTTRAIPVQPLRERMKVIIDSEFIILEGITEESLPIPTPGHGYHNKKSDSLLSCAPDL